MVFNPISLKLSNLCGLKAVGLFRKRHSEGFLTGSILILFCAMALVGMFHHEMWRDEAETWMIARDSPDLVSLFEHQHYTGHPSLWYLLLFALSSLTQDPRAMALLHLFIASLSVYLFLRYSPFTPLQKGLFVFGYFPFYEYALISRAYALGLFFALLFCAVFQTRKKTYWVLALILVLMANTSAYGAMMAIVLGVALAAEAILEREARRTLSERKGDAALSLAIWFFGIAIAILSMIRPGDSGIHTEWYLTFDRTRLIQTLATVWRGYIPVPRLNTLHFWGTNILGHLTETFPQMAWIGAAGVSLGILSFLVIGLVRKPFVLFFFISSTLFVLLFTYLKFMGHIRHHGHLFILLIMALWLSRTLRETPSPGNKPGHLQAGRFLKQNLVLTGLLGIHLFAGLFAWTMDLKYPFSATPLAADFIKTSHLEKMDMIGYKDYTSQGIAGLLSRQIYYPQKEGFGTFVRFDTKRKQDLACPELVQSLSSFIGGSPKTFLLISNEELPCPSGDVLLTPIKRFPVSIVQDEQVILYLVKKKDLSGAGR